MTIYHKNGTIITVQYASIEAAVKAGVSLTGANLTNATLRGAYLTDANLTLGNRRVSLA